MCLRKRFINRKLYEYYRFFLLNVAKRYPVFIITHSIVSYFWFSFLLYLFRCACECHVPWLSAVILSCSSSFDQRVSKSMFMPFLWENALNWLLYCCCFCRRCLLRSSSSVFFFSVGSLVKYSWENEHSFYGSLWFWLRTRFFIHTKTVYLLL